MGEEVPKDNAPQTDMVVNQTTHGVGMLEKKKSKAKQRDALDVM